MTDPFLITGPALISFSGGRTSGYMLWRVLQAHGGTLPDDVVVAFANTGKEREETLRFVHECGSRWGVRVRWLEWRPKPKQAEIALLRAEPSAAAWIRDHTCDSGFEEVGYNSASREGEPFAALIAHRGFAPYGGTVKTRYCSPTLKLNTLVKFMVAEGYDRWVNPVGLRADEYLRVAKQVERNLTGSERFKALMPLAGYGPGDPAGVMKADVMTFWLGPTGRFPSIDLPQGFDLGLAGYAGNCDNCMLKRRGKLLRLAEERPASFEWWIKQEQFCQVTAETIYGQSFFDGDSYAAIRTAALSQPSLFPLDDEEHDAECGLWCPGEAA